MAKTNEEKIAAFDSLTNYYVDYCKKQPIATINCCFKKEIGEPYIMRCAEPIDGLINVWMQKLESDEWQIKHFQVTTDEFKEKFEVLSYKVVVDDRAINTAIRLLGISFVEVDGMKRFVICP
jgi:hypothetical protein